MDLNYNSMASFIGLAQQTESILSLKNSICKKIVSVCLGKASLALALGFIILNPVSAYAACTVGNEIEVNDWDGWAGEGFNPNAAEGGPCVVSQYRAPINRFGGGNWEACTDSGANPSSAKNPGPHAGTTQAGKCISRVWRNGSSNSNATQCKVFGYECSGGGSATAQCSTAEPEKCLSGTYQDETDSPTEYKWSCTSSSGGATASVSCGFSKGVTATNGVCSTTANQCTYGTFADETDTATEFQWRCNGLNGGTNSGICRANKVIPGECGYASGGTYTSSPLAADSLCATGSPSGVTGDGTSTAPWSWRCTGINGGANANCSANLCLPPEDGVCNNTTRNSCASGDLSNAGENATHYTWQCNGRYGGANATNCSRVKNTTTGVCNETVENGCTSGTLNNTADSGTHFLWQCLGSEGGASDNCDMLKPAPVNGACSTSVNGCSAGNFVDVADDAVNYKWQCNGINGGNNQPCDSPIPPSAENGVCNTTTVNGCSKGSAFDISSDTSNDYWKCSGINGGAASGQCTKAKGTTACIPTGQPVPPGQTQCPTDECFVHMAGVGLWGSVPLPQYNSSRIGVDDEKSDVVGAGEYADSVGSDSSPGAFYKTHVATFDSVAISSKARLVVYKDKNFQGGVIYDAHGPLVLTNKSIYDSYGVGLPANQNPWVNQDWSSFGPRIAQFTPATRKATPYDHMLLTWQNFTPFWNNMGNTYPYNLIDPDGTSIKVTCDATPDPVVGQCGTKHEANGYLGGPGEASAYGAVSDGEWCAKGVVGRGNPEFEAPMVGMQVFNWTCGTGATKVNCRSGLQTN